MSIDTDTSTSDTAVVMANGLAGEVDAAAIVWGSDSPGVPAPQRRVHDLSTAVCC
jgi:hypothetical protein